MVRIVDDMFLCGACMCLSDRCPQAATPSEGISVMQVSRVKRTGTVLTVGRLAGTVSESVTKRQYYAPLSVWGDMQVGDVVTFFSDSSRTSGRHRVGSELYERMYCVPACGSV